MRLEARLTGCNMQATSPSHFTQYFTLCLSFIFADWWLQQEFRALGYVPEGVLRCGIFVRRRHRAVRDAPQAALP